MTSARRPWVAGVESPRPHRHQVKEPILIEKGKSFNHSRLCHGSTIWKEEPPGGDHHTSRRAVAGLVRSHGGGGGGRLPRGHPSAQIHDGYPDQDVPLRI